MTLTHISLGVYTVYVYLCNFKNIVNGYIFSTGIIVFPGFSVEGVYRVVQFVFVF